MPVVESLPMPSYMIGHTLIYHSDKAVFEALTQDRRIIGRMNVPYYPSPNFESFPFETLVFPLEKMGDTKFDSLCSAQLVVDRHWIRDPETSDIYSAHTATIEDAALLHDKIVQALIDQKLVPIHSVTRMAMYGLM